LVQEDTNSQFCRVNSGMGAGQGSGLGIGIGIGIGIKPFDIIEA
jgi:hypothetical protein